MAHILLDDAQIHAGFEQVSSIGVAKRVDGDVAFLNTRCAYRVLKRRLHRTV